MGAQHADEVEQQAISHRQLVARARLFAIGAQQVPHRVAQLLLHRLAGQLFAELPVFIDRAGMMPVERLGALGFAEQVEAEGFLAAIVEPLLDGQAIALGLEIFSPFSSRNSS
jgi:hypothetical protein